MDSATPQVIILPRAVVDAMLAHVQADYPNEGCGVLAGADGRVVQHYPATNAADTPETFSLIGSQELLNIAQDIEEVHDWTYFAYYHSHPRTPAYPSPRDIDHSQDWPGMLYIIFSLRDQAHPEMRVFSINRDRSVTEHQVQIEP